MNRSSLPLLVVMVLCVTVSATVLMFVALRSNNEPLNKMVPLPVPPGPNREAMQGGTQETRPDKTLPISRLLPPYPPTMQDQIRLWVLDLKGGDTNKEKADAAERALLDLDCRALLDVDREFQYALGDANRHPNDPKRVGFAQRLERLVNELGKRPYRQTAGNAMPERLVWYPGLAVEPEARRVLAEAVSLPRPKFVEFPVCGPKGKGHEGLFQMVPSAALLAMGLDRIQVAPGSPDKRPRFIRDWLLYDGDTVRIAVRIGETERPLEDYLLVRGAKMPPTGWVLLGLSQSVQNRPVADEMGTIVGAQTNPNSLLTNPWPTSQFEDAYTASPLFPAQRTPVVLVFTPEPKVERDERLKQLEPEWKRYEPERARQLEAMTRPGPRANSNSNSDPAVGADGDTRPAEQRQPLVGHAPAAQAKQFAPLLPAVSPEQAARVRAWVRGLDHFWTLNAAAAHLLLLDARHEALLHELWRENRDREPHADVLAAAIRQAPLQPYIKDGVQYFRGLALDPNQRLIVADGEIARFQNTPLEFLVCGPRGKGHESIVVLRPLAKVLQHALERLGLKMSSLVPDYQGDWKLYDGDSVQIETAWFASENAEVPPALADAARLRQSPGLSVVRLEQFVFDLKTQQPLPPTGFVFIGSPITTRGSCVADERGGIIGCVSFETSVLENPWPGAADKNRYRANLALIPPPDTPVRMVFTPEPKALRDTRLAQLRHEWDKVKLNLPRVEFSAPTNWRKPSRHDWVWLSPKDASFAVMVEPNYTKETSITEDLKKFWLAKTEMAPDFKREVKRWDGTHQKLPAWYFVWEDADGAFVFRAVVMAQKYFYQVFFFAPGRTDLDTLESEFAELMAALDVDHEELRPK